MALQTGGRNGGGGGVPRAGGGLSGFRERGSLFWGTLFRRGRCGGNAGRVQEIQTELDGVFSGGVRQLVREGLKNPGESVAARGAHGVGRYTERHQRCAKEKV